MADSSRGSSFTRALLGVAAKEVHLCGDPSVVDLVRTLVKECNDELEVITYDRLSELEADERPVAKLSDVRKGDCIVTFKRSEIYKIKNQLESSTDMKACVVYGSLPPFIRKSQARLFNDTDSGYHVLIASDAVGLGLNLNIGRMLFSSVSVSIPFHIPFFVI